MGCMIYKLLCISFFTADHGRYFYILEKNSRGDGIYTSSNSTFSPNKEEVLSGIRAFSFFDLPTTYFYRVYITDFRVKPMGLW